MKKIILILIISSGFIPVWARAAAKAKVYSGTIKTIAGNQLEFATSLGAYYSVQTQGVTLVRRYGTPMQPEEFVVGDKIQVTGLVRPDNSLAASLIRNMTLYSHNSTFSGKIVLLNPPSNYVVMESSKWGRQIIHITSATAIKKNSVSATLTDLGTGMTITVKGSWERSGKEVAATNIQATVKLINITISGNLVVRGNNYALTVVAGNTIYGIDASGAQILNQKNKPISISQLGNNVRIWGKHISGSTAIIANKVKTAN